LKKGSPQPVPCDWIQAQALHKGGMNSMVSGNINKTAGKAVDIPDE
jgi:hypothetical protein